MNHKKKFRKFGRDSAHRAAMMQNLATSLLIQERITTTVEKAKDLRSVVERLITKAAKDTVHNRRQAYNKVYSKKAVHKLFAEIGPRYADRPGGYTRVLKTTTRAGDAADLAIIELVDSPVVEAQFYEPAPEEPAAEAAQAEGEQA